MSMQKSIPDIVSYYENCEIDYRLLWSLNSSLALHYGFWTDGVRTLAEAHVEQNDWMARAIDIQASDTVLDAGCGIGGSAIHLARSVGCKALGITLSGRQIELAQENARAAGVADRVNFERRDFTRTDLPDSSFTVVWAIESVCHATDKADFLREAFRLLKPGGRLIVADGFNTRPESEYSERESDLMRGWLGPWAVDQLSHVAGFEADASSVGFQDIKAQDVTDLILPSSRILYRRARLATIPAYILRLVRFRNDIQHGNYQAGKLQWQALKHGLWQYSVVTASKEI